MKSSKIWSTMVMVAVVALSACQGRPSEEPPIHLNPNMDSQPKYKAQSKGDFFADGMSMRTPPEGTVARGQLRDDAAYYMGRDEKGNLVKENPVPVTMALLHRGQERFNIYCSPCHGQTGLGNGIIVQRGMLPPPNFHDERLLKVEDGHFFDVMTNGIRNMSSYKSQVPVADRWAITAYIRALQRTHTASLEDVPQEKRKDLK